MHKCARCGHEWHGSDPNVKPMRCARCKAKYWWQPARIPKPAEVGPGSGAAGKYGFGTIQPGASKLIRWHYYSLSELAMLTESESRSLSEARSKIYPAAMSYARRKGWKIETLARPDGLLVTRIY